MAIEIERRFLVTSCPPLSGGRAIRQGYLALDGGVAVRVRRVDLVEAFLTVKGPNVGGACVEVERAITCDEAQQLFDLCGSRIVEKTRYRLVQAAHVFEVDVFLGANAGLVIVEIELHDIHEYFDKPPWLGPEITGQGRYQNAALALKPYTTWSDSP